MVLVYHIDTYFLVKLGAIINLLNTCISKYHGVIRVSFSSLNFLKYVYLSAACSSFICKLYTNS